MDLFVIWSIPAVGAIILGIVCFIIGKKFENPDNIDYTKAVFVRKETVKPVRGPLYGPQREVLIYEYTVGERTYTKKLDPAYNRVSYEFDTINILYLKSFPKIAYFSFVGDNLQIANNMKGGIIGCFMLAAVMLVMGIMGLFI